MTYEKDGVEYENCIVCKKEIIATKSMKCLDCFQKNKHLTKESADDELVGSYQRLGTARLGRASRGNIVW